MKLALSQTSNITMLGKRETLNFLKHRHTQFFMNDIQQIYSNSNVSSSDVSRETDELEKLSEQLSD